MQLTGYTLEPISTGWSGAAVWRCTKDGSANLYLKTAPLAADLELDEEAARLRWMRDRGLPVPAVRDYSRTSDTEYLLLEEVLGVDASNPQWTGATAEVVAALADGLRLLHRTSTFGCPFDHSIALQLERARLRIAAGHVREDDFDEANLGRPANDILAELVSSAPGSEDLVFTHGDYCVPNIVLRRNEADSAVEIAGFIDCSRSGVADRYQDLALVARSIAFNFGAEWVSTFFERYGLTRPDPEKLHFYTLLDELF